MAAWTLGPRRLGSIGYHDARSTPPWGPAVAPPLATPDVFGLRVRRACATHEGQGDRKAGDAPLGHQDDEANAAHIGRMRSAPSGVGHGLRGTPGALEGAVAHQVPHPIVWRGQSAPGSGSIFPCSRT